jgi:hypothetical protein
MHAADAAANAGQAKRATYVGSRIRDFVNGFLTGLGYAPAHHGDA